MSNEAISTPTTAASGPRHTNRRRWLWAGGAMAATAAVVGLTVPAGATTSTPPAPTPTALGAADCDGHWPLVDNGRPYDFSADAQGGAYVWHDLDGWHLRVTHQGTDRRTFTGKVSADVNLRDHKVADEAHDFLKKSAKSFTFVFNNYGAIDGVDFKTDCASKLTFDLRVGGKRVPVQRISLGNHSGSPATNPFTINRVS